MYFKLNVNVDDQSHESSRDLDLDQPKTNKTKIFRNTIRSVLLHG